MRLGPPRTAGRRVKNATPGPPLSPRHGLCYDGGLPRRQDTPNEWRRDGMGSGRIAPDDGSGMHGSVLSGGPRIEGRADLGPPAFWWEPHPGDQSVGAGIDFVPRGIPGAADPADHPRVEEGDYVAVRCAPILVAYPRPGVPPNVYYAVLGGRVHLHPDGSLAPGGPGGGAFRPAPDLAFALGVELPSDMAVRLGHSAAATSVYRGSPGNCRRPRLLSLVGSRPRLALSQLGQQLLSWKEFPSCAHATEPRLSASLGS